MEALAVRDRKPRVVPTLFIGGTAVPGAGGDLTAIRNPFDNGEICTIAPASTDQVDAAVETAHAAFKSAAWKELTARDRGVLLNQLAQLLRRDLEAFATLEAM